MVSLLPWWIVQWTSFESNEAGQVSRSHITSAEQILIWAGGMFMLKGWAVIALLRLCFTCFNVICCFRVSKQCINNRVSFPCRPSKYTLHTFLIKWNFYSSLRLLYYCCFMSLMRITGCPQERVNSGQKVHRIHCKLRSIISLLILYKLCLYATVGDDDDLLFLWGTFYKRMRLKSVTVDLYSKR